MHEEEQHKKRIYKYCDDNIGKKVSFLVFPNLGLEKQQTPQPNLMFKASVITYDLCRRKVLIEVPKETENDYPMDNFHPTYEISPHEKLIDD